MRKFHGQFIDVYGNKIQGGSVYVYDTGTSNQATLFEDNEVTGKDQPLTTDEYGEYSFKVADGIYDISEQKTGYDTKLTEQVQIYDISEIYSVLGNLTGFDYIQDSTTTGTPSAGGAGEYWLDLYDGSVYVSSGSGTGNWGSALYQILIFNSDGDVNFSNGYALALQNLLDSYDGPHFYFDGSASKGVIANDSSWEITTGDFAVCVWFKTSKDYSGGAGYLAETVTSNKGLIVDINTANKAVAYYTDGTPAQAVSDNVLNDGVWHHLFAIYDRNGVVSLEVDGKLQSTTASITNTDISNGGSFNVGYSGATNFFDGEMLPPRLFNFIPSAAERKLLANPLATIPWYMKGGSNVDLNQQADATADAAGTEANSTGNWGQPSIIGAGVFQSQAVVVATGSYALEADLDPEPNPGGRIRIDMFTHYGLIIGKKYLMKVKARHKGNGTGTAQWAAFFNANGDTSQSVPFFTLESTDTTFTEYVVTFTCSSSYKYFLIGENNSANDGGIYVDDISVIQLGAVIAPDWLATTRDSADEAISTPMFSGCSAPNITWTDTELNGASGAENEIKGVWTATVLLGGASTGISILAQDCRYIKIGGRVKIWGRIYFDKGATSTGALTISGVPYAARNNTTLSYVVELGLQRIGTAGEITKAILVENTTTINFYQHPQSTSAISATDDTDIVATGTNAIIEFSTEYETDE